MRQGPAAISLPGQSLAAWMVGGSGIEPLTPAV